jgi:hypothetical protein
LATRFIHRDLAAPEPVATANGFAFDRDNTLSATLISAAGTQETGYIPNSRIELVTASKAITYADHGKIFLADSTTTVNLSLPATRAGITYTLVVKQLTEDEGHGFDPVAADKIIGNGVTPADGTIIQCTAATDRLGDSLTIVGDGVDGWYITEVTGTWALDS